MKYRTKSAEVLNEADRFERIAAWQDFQMEQERVLYWTSGDTPQSTWTPGTPLYSHPFLRMRSSGLQGLIAANEGYRGLPVGVMPMGEDTEGNCARRMIEEFDDGAEYWAGTGAHARWSVSHDSYGWGQDDIYPDNTCKRCDVGWEGYGNSTCWICGDWSYPLGPVRPPREAHNSRPNSGVLVRTISHMRLDRGDLYVTGPNGVGYTAEFAWNGLTTVVEPDEDLSTVQSARYAEYPVEIEYSFHIQDWLREEMIRIWAGMSSLSESAGRASGSLSGLRRYTPPPPPEAYVAPIPQMQGQRPMLTWIDEWADRESREEAVDLWGYPMPRTIDIPQDVDLSERPQPPLPEPPEPQDFSNHQLDASIYAYEAINQQRRRRSE